MIKTIIIIILLILIFLFNYSENFTIFNPVNENTPNGYYNIDNFYRILFPSNNNTTSIYKNRFEFIPVTINDNKLSNDDSLSTSNYDELKSNKCCLIKKELDNNNFKYTYKKYNDLECDIDNFVLDQNNQLLFDGINNWNNDECKNDNTTLGSCKHYDFECIDFVDEKTCNKYNEMMPQDPSNRKINFTWSNKPCYNR